MNVVASELLVKYSIGFGFVVAGLPILTNYWKDWRNRLLRPRVGLDFVDWENLGKATLAMAVSAFLCLGLDPSGTIGGFFEWMFAGLLSLNTALATFGVSDLFWFEPKRN